MSNSTEHLSSDCRSPSLVAFHIVLSYRLFFMFPIALLLNGIAGWLSLHLDSTSTFIVYLKNLVAADLLITLMIPLKAASMLPGATVEFRAFICRYAGVSFYCSSYTSIVLMGLISLDRFFKIVWLRGKVLGQNMKFSVIMSTLVWILLFGGTAIPNIFLTDQFLLLKLMIYVRLWNPQLAKTSINMWFYLWRFFSGVSTYWLCFAISALPWK